VGLQVVLLGFHYWVFLRSLLGDFLSGYVKAFGIPLLLAAGMGACVLGARAVLPEAATFFSLGAEVITGALAYCGLIWLFMRKEATETLRLAVGRK
jgi:hypothetical protein